MINHMAARLAAVVAFGLALGLVCGLACGSTTKSLGKTALGDVVYCSTGDVLKLAAQFEPTMEQALQRAVGLDGKIDLPSLQEIGQHLEADGWCVLERSVRQLVAAALAKIPGAPAAAAAPLDASDLEAKLAVMRVQKFGATEFQLAGPP